MTLVLLSFSYRLFGYTERIDNTQMKVLGHKLSSNVRDFLEETEALLGKIDFRDIAEHPFPVTRQLDGAHEYDGYRHIVWLKPDNKDFEVFLMHEVMHGVLDKKGYPSTARSEQLGTDQQTYYIGSLLMSVVQDTIIDDHLKQSGMVLFNRQQAIQSKYIDAHSDAQHLKLVPYGFVFCKWALISLHLLIDNTFTEDQREYLSSYIKKKFPAAFKVGHELVEKIHLHSDTSPPEALAAMVTIRNHLRLKGRVFVVDHSGNSY